MDADEEGKPADTVDHFGFDMVGCGGWFDWHAERGVKDILEETDEWKVVRNGSGAALKWWKNKSGTPEHIDFTMTSREVWDREYRPWAAFVVWERKTNSAAASREAETKGWPTR